MKNLLALIGLAVVLVVGLGWYLGWYQVATEPTTDGHRKINVDLNTKKITEDVKKGEKVVGGILSPEGKDAPRPSTPTPTEKKVDGQTTGFQFAPDGSATIILPKLKIKTGD